MDRLACVDLPAFSLQWLLKKEPSWRAWPAAVVAKETPQGEILELNKAARRKGIRRGMCYSNALSLAPSLRAGIITPSEVEGGVKQLVAILQRFVPHVEPVKGSVGVFFLRADGLGRLHDSPESFAEAVQEELKKAEFFCHVTLGFSRLGTLAVSKAGTGVVVFKNAKDEATAAREVSLRCFDLPFKKQELLSKLNINTVGDLTLLPEAELLERLGPQLHLLWKEAAGQWARPFEAALWDKPLVQRMFLDEPESNQIRLTFWIKRMLEPLVKEALLRHVAIAELSIHFRLEKWVGENERDIKVSIRPFEPTIDVNQLVDLVRLKLELLELKTGAVEIVLTGRGALVEREQLLLFNENPKRDLRAADQALARLRSEFGDNSVVSAKLADGHLPEAQFTLEPLTKTRFPSAVGRVQKTFVRRIWRRPAILKTQFKHLIGPYVVSGGWWARAVWRDYYFAETKKGELLWVYFDRVRERWFTHGAVE